MQLQRILVNGQKTVNYLKKNGLKHTYYAAKERLEQQKEDAYHYIALSEKELACQKNDAEIQDNGPKFSVLVPAYETKETYLRELLDSVINQTYGNWEIILADASATGNVERVAREYASESRIKYIRLRGNGGISANTNAGLEHCSGDYVCLADHDDLLTEDALYCMAKAAIENRFPTLLYSDEDKTDESASVFYDVNEKYKFNLDLILSNNYICHLTAWKADVFTALKERPEYDGAQDYDLVLRTISFLLKEGISVKELEQQMIHIPRVLYHWRCHTGSTAENTASKSYAYEAGLHAVEDFLKDREWNAVVEHSLHLGFYKTTYHPDLLSVREDIGAVGGRLLSKKGYMMSCIRDEEGQYLYEGLYKEYSGKMHRFSLRQETATVDMRCMMLRESLWAVFEEVTGIPYYISAEDGLFDFDRYIQQAMDTTGAMPDYEKISEKLCKAIREEGYMIVYEPDMVRICRTER